MTSLPWNLSWEIGGESITPVPLVVAIDWVGVAWGWGWWLVGSID